MDGARRLHPEAREPAADRAAARAPMGREAAPLARADARPPGARLARPGGRRHPGALGVRGGRRSCSRRAARCPARASALRPTTHAGTPSSERSKGRRWGREWRLGRGRQFLAKTPDGFRGRVQVGPEGAPYAVVSDGARFVLVPASQEIRGLAGKTVAIARDGHGRLTIRAPDKDRDR